jgi:glucose-1-phosphate cytidylyltransferase
MKVIILAGGYGTRLGSLSELIPKPMIEIGDRPIIWHIMKTFNHFGYRDFVLCLGYKSNVIKDYFFHYYNYNNDFTIDLSTNVVKFHASASSDDFSVTLVDTGLHNLKGSRLKQVDKYLNDELNFVTYGDGVADIDVRALVEYHKSHGKMVTITGVRPPSMFGEMIEQDGLVTSFEEKPQTSKGLINGGYMVFNRRLMDHLSADPDCDFEFGALEELAAEGQIMTYKHAGLWECADTLRDLEHLNKLWREGKAFWKLWD